MLTSLKDAIKNVMDDVTSKREKWIKYVPVDELSSIIKQYEDAFRIILIKLETQIFVNELESLKEKISAKEKKEKTIGLYDLEAKTLQELLQEDIVENCIDDLDAILSSISILKDAHYTYAHHERWKLVTLTLENVIRKLKQEKE